MQLVFSISKIRDYFSTKDPIPECFRSFVVYKFACANCGIRYVGRTHKHLDTRVDEHFGRKSSSVFQHINDPKNNNCKTKYDKTNCFSIIDNARSDYELAIKEGLHINRLEPELNRQKQHEVITLLV